MGPHFFMELTMELKLLEIRDVGTFIPVMAVSIFP